jgi:hypothetical protein
MSEAAVWETDLGTLGREIGREKSRRLGSAINAVFALIAMIAAGEAGAQGGPCQTNCGDHTLPPIIVTPGGGGGSGPSDPCAGGGCGSDVPPDEGGAPGGPGTPTVCEQFLNANPKPPRCSAQTTPKTPSFGAGCNFRTPVFNSPMIAHQDLFFNACNLQPQCYWNVGDERYCNGLIRERANSDCIANATRFRTPVAACVDKIDTLMHYIVNDPVGLNMMRFQDIRDSVECTRWRGAYHEACR